MMESADDKEMMDECRTELKNLDVALEALEGRILDAIVPHEDEDFDNDAIVEVRVGTGGDEASLFAAELFDSYMQTAKVMRWKVDVLDQSRSDIGGLKEGSYVISGGATIDPTVSDDDDDDDDDNSDSQPPQLLGPYGAFKFESGVHRVQRVPINDSRIHTSACSVAVLPALKETNQDALPPSELRIETMRASGAGGQHVNTTDSAVRITHIPTGITASIQDERSQHKNKAKAMKLITARVLDAAKAEADQARGATRSSLMGGGNRSERIRTYNFPQDRSTDHRCKETRHGIASLLGAGSAVDNVVVSFFPHLRSMERDELLAQLDP